jgi:signal transduction histidine kinase/DNA-binding response OmpR family regulator
VLARGPCPGLYFVKINAAQLVMSTSSIVVLSALVAALVTVTIAYMSASQRNRRLKQQLTEALSEAHRQRAALNERTKLDSIKDEFISTVSHELRTPLTSIRGALGLLNSGVLGKLDDKAANLLRIASTNTDRLVRLINDILDLERMDSGRAPLHVRRCSLHDLVLQAVDTMTSLAEAGSVRLIVVPPPAGEVLAFDGDPDRMQQVLCNLLSNAIKFSPPGATVRILTGIDAANLVLRVEDTGRGVPADKLESIFDRFQQVEASDARQKGGTGLGLAICRSIVSQHAGNIWAERNDAHDMNNGAGVTARPGTTFIVRLPRVIAADGILPLPLNPVGSILVVDDDSNVRHVVGEHLRRNGYTVLEAESGAQALVMAEAHPIEAILLDLYMPGMSGWQTIEHLKAKSSTANIPIVVLSVLSPAARTADGASLVSTTQGWIQKPFNEGLLLAELGRVLHHGTGPGHILLVEDDQDLATIVLSSFESDTTASQVGIQHVSTVGDAMLACRTQAPDILILDLTLPDGSGFALVDWLRRQPTLRTLPLVVYSGRDVSAEEMEQLRLGPTQFLAKARVQPRDVEDLVLAMVRHLRPPILRQPEA